MPWATVSSRFIFHSLPSPIPSHIHLPCTGIKDLTALLFWSFSFHPLIYDSRFSLLRPIKIMLHQYLSFLEAYVVWEEYWLLNGQKLTSYTFANSNWYHEKQKFKHEANSVSIRVKVYLKINFDLWQRQWNKFYTLDLGAAFPQTEKNQVLDSWFHGQNKYFWHWVL